MIEINSTVTSKIHDDLTTWKVEDIITGLSGKKIYVCSAKHDTLLNRGFDKINYDFKEEEIYLD
tara:strand:+ start:571 stop:762 length:192 start_codon:yes stop_codon:yes gene_type:complete